MATELRTEQGKAFVPSGTWKVDPAHSSVEFSVKHLMIATVKGRFTDFDGTIEVGETPATAKAHAVIKAASIDTHEENRDQHLRSPDFFDVEKFPEITFDSKRIEQLDDASFRVVGDLTIKGVTREVELDGTVEGAERDPWGNDRVALELRGEIDRNDFELRWNQNLERGGVLVGDRVRLAIDVSAVKS